MQKEEMVKMREVKWRRIVSALLAVVMSLTMVLVDMPTVGTVETVYAGTYDEYVVYSQDAEWTEADSVLTRTTSWNFVDTNANTLTGGKPVSDDICGIIPIDGTVKMSTTANGLSVTKGTIGIPIADDTESVCLEIKLTNANSNRYLLIGNETVYVNSSAVEGVTKDIYFNSNMYTQTYDLENVSLNNGYFTITSGTVSDSDSGEVKFSSITLTETKTAIQGTALAASITYDGTEIAGFTAKKKDDGTIAGAAFNPASYAFTEVPDEAKLAISAVNGTDALGGTYTVSLDTANQYINVYNSAIGSGNTVLASLPYTIAGQLLTLGIGGSESYDFKSTGKVFGEDSVAANTEILSENSYIKLVSTAELATANGHGLFMQGNTVFTVNVPANTMGQFTINECQYASCSAVMKIDGISQGDAESLAGIDDKNYTKVYEYRNASDVPVKMEIEVIASNGYLHGVTYAVSEIPQEATVSGYIGTAVAGDELVFTDSNGVTTTCTVAVDGNYSVVLAVGTTYTVTLNDANGYKLVDAVLDLTGAAADAVITGQDFTPVHWDSAKTFTVTIGGTTFTVNPGATEDADFSITAANGDGSVELVTATEAILWADLQGRGTGTLTNMVTDSSANVTTSYTDNVLTVTYTDQTSLPLSYTLDVKDNSAKGTPYATGETLTYDFTKGDVISSLYAKGSNYKLTGGTSVSSTDKLVTLTGNSGIYYNDASHGIALGANDTIQIKVAGDATITFDTCYYSGGTITASSANGTGIDTTAQSFGAASTNCAETLVYEYTGDATTLTFTLSGTNYLHKLLVVNAAEETTTNPTNATVVPEKDRVGNTDNMIITPAGQRLAISQSGGSISSAFGGDGNSFYLFPQTADKNVLEFDVVINSCTSGNANGIWVGAFDDNQYMMAIAVRGGTGVTQYYSKSTSNGTSSNISGAVALGDTMHYKMYKDSSKFYVKITYNDTSTNETVTKTASFSSASSSYKLLESGIDTPVYYGLAVSNADVTIANMKYVNEDGSVVYYDQNTYFNPIGVAPEATGISAEVAESREYINVIWTGDNCIGDGKYVLEMSKDGTNWITVAENLTTRNYQYPVSSEEGGNYYFRVTGVLGTNTKPAADAGYVTMTSPVYILAALEKPVASLTADAASITVSWNAVDGAESYEVYRYSYDEGEENAAVITSTAATTYTDTTVEAEMPYYYYVIAYCEGNYSNPSDAIWAVATAGHSGEYVYEDDSAGITITKKSYDTVFSNQIQLEGVSEKAGTVSLTVNGTEAAQQTVAARESFSFSGIEIAEGRNDVNIIVTDTAGNKTRKTFNFVYLTNYDIVVDAAYEGTDGQEDENGIPTYSTVQAAVDSVSGSNSERVVIFVKEGSYNERLTVNTPNISLIGEDSERTVIHYYDETETPKGGDMAKRCAIYIQSGATNFSAENLTFENDYEYLGDGTISNESADALRNDASGTAYVNVRILGYQDTLCANSGTQYYYKCYILGNVDFIYGNDPRAFFNDCQLVFRYAPNKNSGYVCAPKASADADYGLTFYNCQILSENGCSGSKYYLARPWGADAYITWIDCYMGKVLKANAGNPYADMSGNAASAARFYEYGSYGPAYAINADRRQISKTKADEMVSTGYLGWDPQGVVSTIGGLYVGSLETNIGDKFVETEYTTDSYLGDEGDDTGLGKYKLEGYAQSAGVTGGGLLYETSDNYYKVSDAEEFLTALVNIKKTGMASVIELTSDINLGCNEVENFDSYSTVITAHSHQPLIHPTLLETGMSSLKIAGMSGLTIYSSNGSSIKHACVDINGSTNIIIRNIAFDECWEWDEYTGGNYDENDWDYVTIEKGSSDIWIDHCTFYKAYDGVIDAKTPTSESNITISWCEFLPGSENDTFFDTMMDELKNNAAEKNYSYYLSLVESGMTEEQIRGYAYGQKKTHLFGQADTATDAVNLTVTLANNYYYDSMDRMPRMRFGTAHVYNCILDAQDLRDIRNTIANEAEAQKIVSNGASSTCGGHVLLENCLISGITNALNSGNGDSPAGYINAVNTLYLMDGVETELTVGNNNTLKDGALIQDADEFIAGLPYSECKLYAASELDTVVKPYTGAGKLTLTTLQWEKTFYNDDSVTEENPSDGTEDEKQPDDNGNETQPDDTDAPDSGEPFVTDGTVTVSGWSTIKDKIASASEGASIVINMNGATVVPKDIFESAKGRDITLLFDMGNGVTWTVNGKDITKIVGDIDFTVVFGDNAIPADLINGIAGSRRHLGVHLNYSGDFGFTATLTTNVGSESAGRNADLYYYNVSTSELEHTGNGVVTGSGTLALKFTHASDYVIIFEAANETDQIKNPMAGSSNITWSVVYSPETGDNAWNPVWLILLVVGIMLCMTAAFSSRKKCYR